MRFFGKILFVFTILVALLGFSLAAYYYYEMQPGGNPGEIGQIINPHPSLPVFQGKIYYYSDKPKGLYVADPNSGKSSLIRPIRGMEQYIAISRRGDKLAYGVAGGTTSKIFVTPFPGNSPVAVTKPANDMMPTFSPGGASLVYVQDQGGVLRSLLDVNLQTLKTRPYMKPKHWYSDPKFLPDGRIVCTSYLGSKDQIVLLDPKTNDEINLTNNNYSNLKPNVSADGKKIVFVSNRDGNPEIYTMNVDGSEEHRLTFTSGVDYQDPAWSPNGHFIVFSSNQQGAGYNLYIIDDEGNMLKQLTSGNENDSSPVWIESPNHERGINHLR